MRDLASLLVAACMALSLIGCTHVPVNIKSASARQADLLTAFERSLTEQDLAKGCAESSKAALEMEETAKQQGAAAQDRIKKQFADSMGRAQAFKDKAPERAAQKEADAMQTFIEQTTQLRTDMAKVQTDIDAERAKCGQALGFVKDMAHSLASAQAELDKFIQADAKTPIEAFIMDLVETKAIAKKLDEGSKLLQTKMGDAAEKIKAWEGAFGAVKE